MSFDSMYTVSIMAGGSSGNRFVRTIRDVSVDCAVATGKIEVFNVSNTVIIGESHVRLHDDGDMTKTVNELVECADVVILEFDPTKPSNYLIASEHDSAMVTAHELAVQTDAEIIILDSQIPPLVQRFIEEGFYPGEALTAEMLHRALIIFMTSTAAPVSHIDQLLNHPNVPKELRFKIVQTVGTAIQNLASSQKNGYDLMSFERDLLAVDASIRDRFYAETIEGHTDSSRKLVVVVGKQHARPISDLLRGDYVFPNNLKETKARMKQFIIDSF